KGLNVLTGETGAGKTLVIEAINLLIGERAAIDLIRDGEDKLLVQGYFDLKDNSAAVDYLLSENLVESREECDDIVITREFSRKGKNRAFINGIFTRVSNLKKLGELFLDIHGQHDHQYLLDNKTHLEIIDRFGKQKISDAKKYYLESLEDYKKKKNDLIRLKELEKIKEDKLKDLNYRYEEIRKLDIKENEEEMLENEVRILKNYEKIYRLATEAKEIIDGGNIETPAIRESLAVLNKNIEELAEIDHNFKKFTESLSPVTTIVEELGHSLASYLADFDFSSEKLDSIQERLYRLAEIKSKYKMDLSLINEYAEKLKNEIDELESLDLEIEKKQAEYNKSEEILIKRALILSELRKETIDELKNNITCEMVELGFKSVSFIPRHEFKEGDDGIEINNKKIKFTSDGIDDIEFLISLNEGESEKPLNKIASGGEISRIMLAIKSAISSVEKITTMIFDEIDAGIGGATSLIVGEKLYKISRKCQVIAITHLAQIACFADAHYFIDKHIEANRTKIKIKKLDLSDKVREISRMISGFKDSEIAAMHAGELIEKCNYIKNNLDEERKINIEN
ncbi:MAG: DNA repair protein RecN, partial [Actinomycetota bacterium]|nr:DNA repair protein RecN [Actinomycetota bacterium]